MRDTSKDAPKANCRCDVCSWLNENRVLGVSPIKPNTEAWEYLLRASKR